MKKIALYVLFFLISASASAIQSNSSKPYGVITNYGVIETNAKPTQVLKDKVSPSGERRKYKFKDMNFIETTNRIPVQKGIRFGLSFQMRNLQETKKIHLKFRVTHPKMKRADGRISTEEVYDRKLPVKNGYTYGGNSYLLKYDYELLPGEWGFEYIYKGKALFSQKFILYK